jgi:putative intracellular protease/amidase
MFNLPPDATSHKLINRFHTENNFISAVCHGPVALVNVKLSSSVYLFDGQRVTSLSNSEEEIEQVTSATHFKFENELNRVSSGKDE